MITFWCEQAWVAGRGIQPRVRIEADDGGTITAVTAG
ncbi:hypothetical protein, partial [Arthrobacter sp. CAL618]